MWQLAEGHALILQIRSDDVKRIERVPSRITSPSSTVVPTASANEVAGFGPRSLQEGRAPLEDGEVPPPTTTTPNGGARTNEETRTNRGPIS